MKKSLVLAMVLVLLLAISVSVAMAVGDDPVPGKEHFEEPCGIYAGEYGWFFTEDYWLATYSNGTIFLKCTTELAEGQTPPAEPTIVSSGYGCQIPGDFTYEDFAKVYPDGRVNLICKFRP